MGHHRRRAVIPILVAMNIVGMKEAARLNVVLAVIDFGTQILLVIIGFSMVFNPHVLTANVHLGVAPTWARLPRDPDGDDRVHRDRDRLQPRGGGTRPVALDPRSIRLVAIAVFAIYFTLPLIALSALPVEKVGRRLRDEARPPAGGGRLRERPGARARRQPRAARLGAQREKVYVGILAATILFIATNAGVIGASRITYAMASYRQLPGGLPPPAPAVQDSLALAPPSSPGSSRSSCSSRADDFLGTCTRSARCSRSRSLTSRSSRCG